MKYLFYLGIIITVAVVAFLAYYFYEHRNAWENTKTVFGWILSLAFYTFVAYLISGYILSKFTINVRILLSIFILLLFALLTCVFVVCISTISEKELKKETAEQKEEIKDLTDKLFITTTELEDKRETLDKLQSNITAFPYMAGIAADYETIKLKRMADSLDWGSDKQRLKKAADIRVLREETKQLLEQYKVNTYKLEFLTTLYPDLVDILNSDFNLLNVTSFEEIKNPGRRYPQPEERRITLSRFPFTVTNRTEYPLSSDVEIKSGRPLIRKVYFPKGGTLTFNEDYILIPNREIFAVDYKGNEYYITLHKETADKKTNVSKKA